MSADTVATVYAQALFEACNNAGKVTEAWQELGFLADVWKQERDFRLFLNNPSVDKGDKQKLIDKVFGGLETELVKSFLGVLVRKDRIGHLVEITNAFEYLVNEQAGVEFATVESAVPLDDNSKKELTDKLSSRFGKKMVLREEVNADLLGGFVVRVGDTVIDGSVKRNVADLANTLANVGTSDQVWETN